MRHHKNEGYPGAGVQMRVWEWGSQFMSEGYPEIGIGGCAVEWHDITVVARMHNQFRSEA